MYGMISTSAPVGSGAGKRDAWKRLMPEMSLPSSIHIDDIGPIVSFGALAGMENGVGYL